MALAAWENWTTHNSMQRLVEHSVKKLTGARRPWHECYRPRDDFVLTCQRFNWAVINAVIAVADNGRCLNSRLDPPTVVQKQCMLSVQMCRWERVEKLYPRLAMDGSGRGATMEPIWQSLRSAMNDANWNPELKGSLKSAFAGRQWT